MENLGQSFIRRHLASNEENISKFSNPEVDKVILNEAKKLLEFDNLPKGTLENLLKKFNRRSGINEIEMGSDFSLEDLKLSSRPLNYKMAISEDLELFKNDPNMNEASKLANKSQKKLEKTVRSVKSGGFLGTKLWQLQARFGSTTASFFNFSKWMIILNLLNALVILGLIFTPGIYHYESREEEKIQNATCLAQTYNKVPFFVKNENQSECCSQYYDKIMTNTADFQVQNVTDNLLALFTGTLWMEKSFLFYGHYQGTFTFEFQNMRFDFPLIYFLVMTAIFVLNMTVIVISSASSVKKQIQRSIEYEDGRLGIFPVIYSSWDWNIT